MTNRADHRTKTDAGAAGLTHTLRALPRELWILAAASLVNRAGTMALPFLVLYLTRGLGWTAGHASLLLLSYGAGALAAGPVSGRLVDRYGARPTMILSLAASGIFLVVYPLAKSVVAVAALTIGWAATNEMFRPANLAAVAALVPASRRRVALGVVRAAINLGFSIGPAIGGFLADRSFPALFVVDGVTSMAGAAVLAAGLARHRLAPPADSPRQVRAVLADRRFVYFVLAAFPVMAVFFQFESGLPLYMVQTLGFAPSVYGLLLSFAGLLIVLFEIPINHVIAEWKASATMPLGALLVGAGFGAMAFARTPLEAAATVAIWTAGEMVFVPSSFAYISEISPEIQRGSYLGYFTSSWTLALATSPALGTAALAHLGGRTLWAACFAACAIAAILLRRVSDAVR